MLRVGDEHGSTHDSHENLFPFLQHPVRESTSASGQTRPLSSADSHLSTTEGHQPISSTRSAF